MNFTQPIWLFTGIFVTVGLLFIFRTLKNSRMKNLEKFASHKLLGRLTTTISPTRRRYKNVLILIAIFICFVALARPQYGHKWVEVKRKGIDLLFALDVSNSMMAQDFKPDRLKRASLAILDFVQQLEGDRVGLMPFAGSAYLMCPLTLDYEAFEHSLSAVSPGIIPQGGTNLSAVINKAVETLDNEANHKILIVLTDGGNLQGDALSAATEAAEKGLKIYTVGVGTREGELIPLENGGFAKDESGNFVTSKLDEKMLSEIAEKTSGLYVPLGNGGEGLATIYQQKLSLIPKEELAERRHKIPLEHPEWPLAVALILLSLEFCIGERRIKHKLPSIQSIRNSLKRGKNILPLVIILLATAQSDVYAGKGEEAYQRGDYLKASEYYNSILEKNPDDPKANYNIGTTAYKNNMLDDAITAFTKALKSEDVELQQRAYFNLGNSHYQKGAEMAQADQQKAIEQWKQAISSLDSSLELDPQNQPAKENRAFIQKKLEELEKQQEQQDKQQKDENQNNDQSGDDNSEQQKNEKPDNDSEKSSTSDSSDKQDNQKQDSENKSGESEEPKPSTQDTEKADKQIDEQQSQAMQAAEDAKRQQQGQMTKEEAERLLNALKNEEGELNFVPAPNTNNEEIKKDW